jgi:carbon storage regulator
MLVLSRKVGEKIVIGDNITITIQRVAGGRVSLAIEAPREVRILRGELDVFDAPRQPAVTGVSHGGGTFRLMEDHVSI